MGEPPSSVGAVQVSVTFSEETPLHSMGPGVPGTSRTVTLTDSSFTPKGLLAVMTYSPVSFLLAYLMVRVEEVAVVSILTRSEGLKYFPPLDQHEVGAGLPKILVAVTTMVSPARTVRPSLTWASMMMLGAAVG